MLTCSCCRLTTTHLRPMMEQGGGNQTWNGLRPFPKLLMPEKRMRKDAESQRKEMKIISFLRPT